MAEQLATSTLLAPKPQRNSGKRKQNNNDEEQSKAEMCSPTAVEHDLEYLYSQLELSISAPRIERRAGRSHGVWNDEKSLVEIKRKEGKFQHFGFNIDGKLYLEYYEALYLLEVDRLQLEKDGMVQSIEQSYLLLLGEKQSPKFNEYLVYSYLTHAGYILIRHQNKFFSKSLMQAPTEIDCIWAWLANAVEKRAVPSYIKKTELFAKMKQQIEALKSRIIEPAADSNRMEVEVESQTEVEVDCKAAKRLKLQHEKATTAETPKHNLWTTVEAKSQLGFLMDEAEFKQFENLFQSFDVIDLATTKNNVENSGNFESDNDSGSEAEGEDVSNVKDLAFERKLPINFDLYLPNNGFKQNALMPPIMRIMILDAQQSFPNYAEICNSCRHLWFTAPLLIVSVGDAKQIQAFLYLST